MRRNLCPLCGEQLGEVGTRVIRDELTLTITGFPFPPRKVKRCPKCGYTE